ncbi:hypothetical protein PsorP6_009279 [Peronosclerospora sorghi]|uniref:Uncharacterized protein n=1 Tax=Peronosclerospora sorghi TaxID=230839 RepID=A0ACC0W089_9STRA|nr:hypothetical protein PsorP6_009279 [Peronosclerospora sorghi]
MKLVSFYGTPHMSPMGPGNRRQDLFLRLNRDQSYEIDLESIHYFSQIVPLSVSRIQDTKSSYFITKVITTSLHK